MTYYVRASERSERFPLRRAYVFAEQNGLFAAMKEIKELQLLNWPKKNRNPTVRRGRMIRMFEDHGLLEQFIDQAWPFGRTPAGASEIRHSINISQEYDLFLKVSCTKEHTALGRCDNRLSPVSRQATANLRSEASVRPSSPPPVVSKFHSNDSHPSHILRSIAEHLLTASANPAALRDAYTESIQTIIDSPPWSADAPLGLRIPWRLAAVAEKHSAFGESFGSPGIYLFGNLNLAHVYLGKTHKGIQTLGSRLRNRYVCGQHSQCELAAEYARDGHFSTETLQWANMHKKGTRLKHAAEFKERGIEGIWFTLLPIPNREMVDLMEDNLIRIANAWNRSHGHPPMINKQRT